MYVNVVEAAEALILFVETTVVISITYKNINIYIKNYFFFKEKTIE
jgi:hypothetical protein